MILEKKNLDIDRVDMRIDFLINKIVLLNLYFGYLKLELIFNYLNFFGFI